MQTLAWQSKYALNEGRGELMPTEETGDQRLERLRRAIDEGDQSGEPEPFDVESFFESKRRRQDRLQ
ncbi:type II toxin-antitoxin system ParD family antitoxin [Mesorhizobium sp. CO1-1-7]|uniref:type II toxin-antitoxin system ParD family antitoxin n=1 Tax=Mesorhizobium sp. CO1-1-7 TaxID=2876632 RepID=UPI001CD09EFF|nr:type II toxin-antitoxin system ParD family antitoxin [Mesorhizobium sp. CO1-1-7]MBZ9746784.1 type II toxin-antitoxin system ParD family antitoxin [Mesorhizobium sp. CO1-1-7]